MLLRIDQVICTAFFIETVVAGVFYLNRLFLVYFWRLFPLVNRPRREATHLFLSSADIRNAWSYTYILHTFSWCGT
jgi:hypothetical protein